MNLNNAETSQDTSLNVIPEYIQKYRNRGDRFRVLIIGRANAGKTTILQRTCNTTENPVIYGRDGKLVDPSVLESTALRGLHDIENEMVFKSSPNFRFHDSRGFESGGVEELVRVKAFIENRCRQIKLEHQLHVIWYCIPVDDSRLFTAAEQQFFAECGNGNVPIIIIFTKFDALDNKAFKALRDEKFARSEALRMAPKRALADFETVHREALTERLRFAKSYVYLRDMNKETADVALLMTRTADALDDKSLQQLFVSTQRNNLELCIRYALEHVVMPLVQKYKDFQAKFFQKETQYVFRLIIHDVLIWFPHFATVFNRKTLGVNEEIVQRPRNRITDSKYYEDNDDVQNLVLLLSHFNSLSRCSEPVPQMIQLGIFMVHISDFSFLLWNKGYNDVVSTALEIYHRESNQDAITQSIEEASTRYEPGTELSNAICQIAMDHRLSPDLMSTVTGTNRR